MTTKTTTVHPDHYRAAIHAAHAETLRGAIDWLELGDAFISTTGELVVRAAGAGSLELREELHPDHLEPGALRRQLIALAGRLRSLPATTAADDDDGINAALWLDYPEPSFRAADMTNWLACIDKPTAERLAPQVDARMNDPRVQLIRRLAAKGPEDLCAPGTLRQVLSIVDIERIPEEDASMLLEAMLGLLPESQLGEVAVRAQAELDKLAELERQHTDPAREAIL